MKKILTIVLVAFSAASFAQVSVGPKLGLGLSTIKDTKVSTGNTAGSYTSIITPQIGAVLNVQMGDIFALRPELLFVQRGFKQVQNGFTTVGRVSYLELPINVAAGFQAGPGKLEFFAGPSFGFGLGGKIKSEGNGSSNTTTVKSGKEPASNVPSNTVYLNGFNASLNFGIDYKFDNGLLIQAGYNLGLTNMLPHYADSNAESTRSEDVTKASAFNFGVAYLFGGK